MHIPTLPPPPKKATTTNGTRSPPPPPPQRKTFTAFDSPRWRGLCCHSLPASAYPGRDRVNRPVDGWGLQFSGGPPSALPSPRAGQPETRNQNPPTPPPYLQGRGGDFVRYMDHNIKKVSFENFDF